MQYLLAIVDKEINGQKLLGSSWGVTSYPVLLTTTKTDW